MTQSVPLILDFDHRGLGSIQSSLGDTKLYHNASFWAWDEGTHL